MNNVARAVGRPSRASSSPPLAKVVLRLNAVSFARRRFSLMIMDKTTLTRACDRTGEVQCVKASVNVAATPKLLFIDHDALVGMLAYEFQVTLPIVAGKVFHGSAEVFRRDDGVDGRRRSDRWALVSVQGRTGTGR